MCVWQNGLVPQGGRRESWSSAVKFDSKKQRQIMGQFATGVTVASTIVNGQSWGMTANAVTSLSLEPPLVLLAVDRDSKSQEMFQSGGCFALNILAADQQDLSNRFAFSGPKDFDDLETKTAETGSPILTNALAWVDCRVVDILPGGDHDIFIGEILAGDLKEGSPLLFYAGRYAELADLQ
jgi:flavin reductase (DIM6/NTAB) family NADH-FMN oxidoreductase RutF